MPRWKEPYNYQEVIEVTAAKRLFNLSRRYEPGMGDLLVYVNGILVSEGDMYTEVNPYAIEFVEDLQEGEYIIVRYQKLW